MNLQLKTPQVLIPGPMIPSWNLEMAKLKGVTGKVLLVTWGGLGDQVCAEPAIRWALKNFPNKKIYLASECPELFSHLKFEGVFDLRKERIDPSDFMAFYSIVPTEHLAWDFYSHCLTQAVDYCSICMFKKQLPIRDREIILTAEKPHTDWADSLEKDPKKYVAIHAGKHWPSKTFPKVWWDSVLKTISEKGLIPILVGKDGKMLSTDGTGTVDVNPEGCIDLRNQTNLKELVWLLQNCKVLISNDSSPIHIAASGSAHIGFIASCKHPDYITHWRNGSWGWRTKNLGHDGIWNYTDHFPAQDEEVKVDVLPDGLMEKILPTPSEVLSFIETSLAD
nr:hypothetical protein HAGR004_24990 [Bdellovibrio sp. HAGR004]